MKISLSIKFSIGRRHFVLGNLDIAKTSRDYVGAFDTVRVRRYCRWLSARWKVQTPAQAAAEKEHNAFWEACE